MAEILGLGCTHWPTLCLPNERLTDVFHRVLNAPNVDPAVKDPANWPSELLAELGNDNGLGAARRCGERFGSGSPPVCSKIGPNLQGLMLTVAPLRSAISANGALPR